MERMTGVMPHLDIIRIIIQLKLLTQNSLPVWILVVTQIHGVTQKLCRLIIFMTQGYGDIANVWEVILVGVVIIRLD